MAAKQALGVGSTFDDPNQAHQTKQQTPLQALVDPLPLGVRTFMAGLVGGGVATLAVHPADTIRTRLQLRSAAFMNGQLAAKAASEGSNAGANPAGDARRSGIASEIRAIWAEGGVRVLYAGAAARVVKRTLSTALTWTIFEQGMRLIQPKQRKRNANRA
jgi:hypothetical protein